MRANHPRVFLILLTAISLLASCNNNGGGNGEESRLSGIVTMGPLSSAQVDVFELLESGQRGDLLSSTTASIDATFETTLRGYEGWVLIRASGGTTINPATGQEETIPPEHPLIGFAKINSGSDTVVQVSPLTTLAMPILVALCQQIDARVSDQAENALRMVASFFGLPSLEFPVPADLTAGPVLHGPAANAGVALAAISQASATYGTDTMTYVARIGQDLQDLKGDGLRFGMPFSFGSGPGSLTLELRIALTTFLLGGRGQVSGIAPMGTTPWQAFSDNPAGDMIAPDAVWAVESAYGDVRAPVEARIFLDPNSSAASVSTYEIRLGDIILSSTKVGGGEIHVDIPAGLDPGSYDLCVKSFATGLATRVPEAVTVGDSQAQPVVDAFSPNRAPTVGGTLVTFTGNNLYPTTEILLNGVLMPHVESHPPKRLVVMAPPHPEQVLNVEVRNPTAAPLFLPVSFTYTRENLAGITPVPSQVTPLKIHVTKFLETPMDGPMLSTSLSTMAPSTENLGTFLGEELRLSGNAPGLESLLRSGPAFLGHEIRRRSILLSDAVSGASDFLRLDVHPRTSIFAGSTKGGIVTAWPVPSNVAMDTVAGRYGVSGLVLDRARALVGQCFGWLEIDAQGLVTYNLLQYAREVSGGTHSVEYIQDSFRGTIAQDGSFLGQSTMFPGSLYRGAFEGTGAVGCLNFSRPDFLACLSLQRIEYGQTSRGFGHLEGAAIRQSSTLGVGTWQHQTFQRMQETESDGQTLSLGIEQTTAHSASMAESAVVEGAKFQNFFVSPSGIVRTPTGEIHGLNSETGGNWMATGSMLPLGSGATSGDRSLSHGVAIHTDQSISAKSFFGNYAFMEFRSSFSGHNLSGAPPSLELDLRSRYEPIVVQNDTPGEWQGRDFNQSGTIPTWQFANTSGIEKRLSRIPTGGIVSSTTAPQTFGATVLYACAGDRIHLIATELRPFPGRLSQVTEFPHLLGSLKLSHDAEVLIGAEPAGAMVSAEYTLIRQSASPTTLQGPYDLGFLSHEFPIGVVGSKAMQVGRGGLSFATPSSFTHDLGLTLLQPNGTTQQSMLVGQGTFSQGTGGQLELQIPQFPTGAPSRSFWGKITPSGDFGVFFDFTQGSTEAGRINLIRPSATSEPFARSYMLQGSGQTFLGGTAQPAPEILTSSFINFAPTLGMVNYLGETRIRGNETPEIMRLSQFQAATTTTLGNGIGTLSLPGTGTVLDFFVTSHGRVMARPSALFPHKPSLWVGLAK